MTFADVDDVYDRPPDAFAQATGKVVGGGDETVLPNGVADGFESPYVAHSYNPKAYPAATEWLGAQSREKPQQRFAAIRGVAGWVGHHVANGWQQAASAWQILVGQAILWAQQGDAWRPVVLVTAAACLFSVVAAVVVFVLVLCAATASAVLLAAIVSLAACVAFLVVFLAGTAAVVCVAVTTAAAVLSLVAAAGVGCALLAGGTALSAYAWWRVLHRVASAARSSSRLLPARLHPSAWRGPASSLTGSKGGALDAGRGGVRNAKAVAGGYDGEGFSHGDDAAAVAAAGGIGGERMTANGAAHAPSASDATCPSLPTAVNGSSSSYSGGGEANSGSGCMHLSLVGPGAKRRSMDGAVAAAH